MTPAAPIRRGRLLLVLFLVALNAYAAVILYTFIAAPRVPAFVDRCEVGSRTTTCYGTWRVDSGTEQGEVVGARDEGEAVVRVGPIGTYLDDRSLAALRVLPAAIFDVVVPGAWLVIVGPLSSGRGRHRRALLDVPPGGLAVVVKGGRAVTGDESEIATLRQDTQQYATVVDAEGSVIFTMAFDMLRVHVSDPDGEPWGSVGREWAQTLWRFTDVAGREIAQVDIGVDALFSGRPFPVVDSTGRQIGAVAAAGMRGLLVRLEPPVHDPMRALLLAMALAAPLLVETPP